MSKVIANITIGRKKHSYTIEKKRMGQIYVECRDANIAQNFLAEDVPGLLVDLPNLITAEKNYAIKNSEVVRFRISPEDKAKIERNAVKSGYNSLSDYMRRLVLK